MSRTTNREILKRLRKIIKYLVENNIYSWLDMKYITLLSYKLLKNTRNMLHIGI